MSSGNKVLVVDDDEAIREAVHIVLDSEGFEVLALAKGSEVMEAAKIFQPQVIIVDYLLADGDGVELVKALKADVEVGHTPVVLFTAHPEGALHAKNCGADAFLPKPFEVEQLIELLRLLGSS